MKHLLLCGAALSLVACGGAGSDQAESSDVTSVTASATDPIVATFDVINISGSPIGTVTISDEDAGGVTLSLDVTSIPQGSHAIHFHENGRCDIPDFKSAGGHYNPMEVNHGFESEAPNPHAGDMRNFDAPMSGVVQTDIRNERVSLSDREGLAPLYDEDGTALIIHASADDYMTQPTGAAGGRIACAVIMP